MQISVEGPVFCARFRRDQSFGWEREEIDREADEGDLEHEGGTCGETVQGVESGI